MKVVSLWQPHASLVVCGEKKIETRHFYTPMRERVYIHAALKWDKDLWTMCMFDPFAEVLQAHGIVLPQEWRSANKSRGNMPFGAVIGEVDWVNCCEIQMNLDGDTQLRHAPDSLLTDQEMEFGNYDPGRWAHILSNPVRYAEPIPFKGKQSFAWEAGIITHK